MLTLDHRGKGYKKMHENRQILIEALSHLRPEWKDKLDSLRQIAQQLQAREDLVWHMIVQSLAGMGNNRGYFNLIENPINYRKISWLTVSSLSDADLVHELSGALSIAKVRMPEKKAEWLCVNYRKIQNMGGLVETRRKMDMLGGYEAKLLFFKQFKGIDEKYGRNIWMDLYDKDFRNSIAIDTRILKICELVGIRTQNYSQAEIALLDIAKEANREGWEVDRLLFHFREEFVALLNTREKDKTMITHSRVLSQGSTAISRRSSLREEFEAKCKVRINTRSMKGKARHLELILRHFDGRIPLTVLVSQKKRKELSLQLFHSKNEYNYVRYVIWMSLKEVGDLSYDGDYIVKTR